MSDRHVSVIRRIHRAHLAAVLVLGALSLLGSVLLYGSLSWWGADPSQVHLTSVQQVRTQEVVSQLFQLTSAKGEQTALLTERTQDLLAQLKRGHAELSQRAVGSELETLYRVQPAHLDARVPAFVDEAQRLVGQHIVHGSLSLAAVQSLAADADALAPYLKATFEAEEAASAGHTAWVGALDLTLLLLQLGALAAVWTVVLRPIAGNMRREHLRLMATQQAQRIEADRQAFARQLDAALEMAEQEHELLDTVSRALVHLPAEAPFEVLLADNSRAHMRRAVVHSEFGAPGCGVETPHQCIAIRRGRPSVFADSEAMDACPRLRGRAWPCGGVCVPLVFMGETIGVAHASFDAGMPIPETYVERMTQIAEGTAARLSSIRAFRQVELQATTDPLTGLLNRRALEERVRRLVDQDRSFAVVIADIDHFKRLNDKLGHEAGDRGIVTFAKAMEDVTGEHDLVARFGGEEFIAILVDSTAEQAALVMEGLRRHLARVVAGADTPTFTASYGVSDTRVGDDLGMLIQVADAALLRAKDEGRDRVIIADMGDPLASVPSRPGELAVARPVKVEPSTDDEAGHEAA